MGQAALSASVALGHGRYGGPRTGHRARQRRLSAPISADILAANGQDLARARERQFGPRRCWIGWSSMSSASKPWRRVWRTSSSLADPIGSVAAQWTRPNGLDISRVRVPLGVIGII